jgi:papain like protease
MPIRMVDDPNEPRDSGDDSGGGSGFGGGGGSGLGGLFGLLPLIFGLFGRRSGCLVFILLLIAGGYFLFGRSGCGIGGGSLSNAAQKLFTGGFLDPKQFEKANIYESLTDDPTKNPLPEAANLQKYAPPVGDQGHQGSCVAWSSAYAARTIEEAARTGGDPNSLRFSPAFLYNQIGMENCDGSYIEKAMEYMTQSGSIPYSEFPYTDQDCSKQPDQQQLDEARQFKMRGFNRLTPGDRNNVIDLHAIKENIAQGAPVVIGMMVGNSYMQPMMGKDLWEPTQEDRSMLGLGGHAQCVVGYDDKKYGGAFLLMNSWGSQWGNNGFAWVRYPDFRYFVREAYGIEPMARTGAAANEAFSCEIGLVAGNNYIPLQVKENNIFETIDPIPIGTRFKMEVKNTRECYVYVFGKETNGTSYTLFPYPQPDEPTKTRYSPFCGITGYRLFPKDKSMTPDSIGTRDEMAVVISKQPLDWYTLNKSISANPREDYAARLDAALGSHLIKHVVYKSSAKGNMQFTLTGDLEGVIATIIEISKK